MPKRVSVSSPTPTEVAAATEVFGTELRVHLLRFFAQNPGSRQADAVRALGVDRAVVSFNANVLAGLGVLRVADDHTYRVDQRRCRRLSEALGDFISSA